MRLLVFLALVSLAPPSFASGFGPWTFGMTAGEIRAVTSHGPYDAFTNGDLETYNATLCGEKENVQFYLKSGRLWRVVVVTYEGTSLDQATKRWESTYSCLEKLQGPLETPGLKGLAVEVLAKQASKLVAKGKKIQMAPVTQAKDRFVFSSFDHYIVKETTFYRVWINYDNPSS